ncbi:ornithine--oxo-acid transaminase [Parvibium lacunae]|uniref:ornithine aminotransferase n=1 Tax=Parvibium lacunae TaxID=1888893 RepID=A0A368L3M4_9BURK|nr:ornithine--oxo-acid transaminase [Parvibium lacunae]
MGAADLIFSSPTKAQASGLSGLSASSQLIQREQQVAAHNYHPLPIVIERGQDVWLWDADGKRYLDMLSAYSAVSHGHLHPTLVAAMQAQLEKVAVASRAFHSSALVPFLEKLCAMSGFERALPMNSGAEAVETAIKAARRWAYQVKGLPPNSAEILVARQNFHGRTTGIISFSSEQDYRHGFGPYMPGFKSFTFGDMASLDAQRSGHTCAVLIEPIQGEAGIVLPPAGWLKAVRAWCDQHQILLILDEIQSGLGRTGRLFAYQHADIRPDAVIVGKALGGGLLPVSAFLADRSLMDVFSPGSHGSTFGGNALAAAVGFAALTVLEEENLIARSAALGQVLLAELHRLQQRYPTQIQAVRGLGLWAGVDIRAPYRARDLVERLAQKGVLSKETHDTVIRFAPPLTITRADLLWALAQFEAVLAETAQSEKGQFSAERPYHDTGNATPVSTAPQAAPSQPLPAASSPRFLLSAPDHFTVSYSINPWMQPQAWAPQAERLKQDAQWGWQQLRQQYELLGAQIELQPPVAGLPDMVFTANAGVVLDGKVLLARYACPERQGEEPHGQAIFTALCRQGVIQSLHYTPVGVPFEGAGDAIWDAQRQLFWCGYGQRSSYAARQTLEAVFQTPTLALELVDPRFYHLDTCFCLLSGGEVIYYPPAFSEVGRQQLAAVVGSQLIEAGEDDALHLGVNSVCIGQDIVMCHCSPALKAKLTALGYRVHVIPLGSFNRSGGAAYCLTLRLDSRRRATLI